MLGLEFQPKRTLKHAGAGERKFQYSAQNNYVMHSLRMRGIAAIAVGTEINSYAGIGHRLTPNPPTEA
jgi:hypothetical protein